MELTKQELLALHTVLEEKLDDLREVGDDPDWYAEVCALFEKVNDAYYQ